MQYAIKKLALLAAAASLTSALPTKQQRRSFDVSANNNLAVWWGNSPEYTPLADICKDTASDIVILTFAGYAGGKWSVDGSHQATADDIKACQSAGKKVFMSIGGANGAIAWTGADEAKSAADAAYSAYLSSSGMALDGIDLDLENQQPAHWDDFAKELRSKMTSSQYISAAPQCPSPDASLPFSVLDLTDLVWIQYYNNPGCGHGSTGFDASVKEWSSKLTKAKLYIAAPASKASAGSGYLEPDAMAKEIAAVKAMNLPNFGGYALWDASTAKANSDYGAVMKKALGGSSGSGSGSGPAPSYSSGASSPSSAAATSATSATSAQVTAANTQVKEPAATSVISAAHTQVKEPAATSAIGGATTVQATSTAVVTSTAYATAASATAAIATDAASSAAAPAATGSSSSSTCTQDGAIVCSADGKQFGLCSGGSAFMMVVSDGTTCSNGQIAAVSA